MSQDINTSSNPTITVDEETHNDHGRRNSRSQFWVFTRNNYTEVDLALLSTLVSEKKATYLGFGKEVGERGTRHLQGYIEFPTRLRFTQVKALLPGCWLDTRRGTAQQADEYCQKEGDYISYGTRSQPQQGRRKDLERVATLVKEGASLKRIAAEEPEAFIKYHKGIATLKTFLQVMHFEVKNGPWKWPQPTDITTLVIVGPTGIGKTEFAKSLLPKALFIRHLDRLLEYQSEEYEGIIFDDMAFTHMHREAQIHLLDWDCDSDMHIRYTVATIPRNTRKIFTCNERNGPIFDELDPAIKRRITNKIYLD